MNFKKILFYLTIFNFLSCNKDYTYTPQPEPNLLVINAILSNETGISVHVSLPLLTDKKVKKEDLWVKDAAVYLFDETENKSYLLEYRKEGFYGDSLFKPIPVHSYRIEASSPKLPKAVSESIIMPQPMNIEDIVVVQRDDLGALSGTNTKGKLVNFSFDDDKGEDFYNFRLKIADNATAAWAHGGIYNLLTSCEQLEEGFLKDICFDGVKAKLEFEVAYQKSGPVNIFFERISKSYYKYIESKKDIGGVVSFFEEPLIRYSNIKNGYGVFIAKNTQKILFKL
jgi:hypothetical protein